MKKLSKQDYITAFKQELIERDGKIQELDLDQLTVHNIWKNPTADGGMRLTDFGWKLLTDYLNLDSWGFPVDNYHYTGGPGEILLLLDRHIDCPYFINNNSGGSQISIFNSKLATAIAIQGSINKFIKNREKRKKVQKNA